MNSTAEKDIDLSQETEKRARPGLFRRFFRGGEEAVPEVEAPSPLPAPREAEFSPPALETPAPALEAEPPPSTPAQAPASPAERKRNWLKRLHAGLSRSSTNIGRGIGDLFSKRKLDADARDDLEDVLTQADLGRSAATRIRDAIARGRYDKGVDPEEVKAILAGEVERALGPGALPLDIPEGKRPFVILIVGVNGSGKTTTIGKLAAKFRSDGLTVMLAAGDTFRAAAVEQLRVWARRTGSDFVERKQGADAAGLAFDALTNAREDGVDVVLMDTAGRLQNRAELMGELEKIIRVMKKVDAEAPHAALLVLDATVGQNALSQVEIFGRTAGVTG